MGPKLFHFRKFSIAQDICTHKVGTDGVLLGAWVNVDERDTSILDIGTGSGIIAIMLAQRTSSKTRIDALDIGANDIQQARENAQRSPWPEKVNVLHTSLQDFFPEKKYDLIISNPPYFVKSLLSPDRKRTLARHAQQLPFEDLLKNAARLVSGKGRLAVILPYMEGMQFVELAQNHHLFVQRQAAFRSRNHKPTERLLIELSPAAKQQEQEEIILYGNSDEWSHQYKRLTGDFYLKD